jgi:hypothetical protein
MKYEKKYRPIKNPQKTEVVNLDESPTKNPSREGLCHAGSKLTLC